MFHISPMIETPPTAHDIRMMQTIAGICFAALLSACLVMGAI